MSPLDSLAQVLTTQGRHFVRDSDERLYLQVSGRQSHYQVALFDIGDGWVLAQVFIPCEGIEDFVGLQDEIMMRYRGFVDVSFISDEEIDGDDEEDAPRELSINSSLIPPAIDVSLDFFIQLCNDLYPYLAEVAQLGVWDLEEFHIRLSGFSKTLN